MLTQAHHASPRANGHVDKVEIELKLFGDLKRLGQVNFRSILRDEKQFTYDHLNKTNMSDFVRKLTGTYEFQCD